MDSGRSISDGDDNQVNRSSTGTSSAVVHTSAPNGSTYVNYQDDDECIDEAFESSGAKPAVQHDLNNDANTGPSTRCVAVYNFQVGSLHSE